MRRPYTPEERAKYGNKSTPQEREAARTFQLVEQTKNLWATAPVDFPAELKAYLRAGKPAPLMQRCLDAIPLLMQGAMPKLDSRGMLMRTSTSEPSENIASMAWSELLISALPSDILRHGGTIGRVRKC